MLFPEVTMLCDEKKPEHTRGEDYAICNGNPNKSRLTMPRKEYEAMESDRLIFSEGLVGRQPL